MKLLVCLRGTNVHLARSYLVLLSAISVNIVVSVGLCQVKFFFHEQGLKRNHMMMKHTRYALDQNPIGEKNKHFNKTSYCFYKFLGF